MGADAEISLETEAEVEAAVVLVAEGLLFGGAFAVDDAEVAAVDTETSAFATPVGLIFFRGV